MALASSGGEIKGWNDEDDFYSLLNLLPIVSISVMFLFVNMINTSLQLQQL